MSPPRFQKVSHASINNGVACFTFSPQPKPFLVVIPRHMLQMVQHGSFVGEREMKGDVSGELAKAQLLQEVGHHRTDVFLLCKIFVPLDFHPQPSSRNFAKMQVRTDSARPIHVSLVVLHRKPLQFGFQEIFPHLFCSLGSRTPVCFSLSRFKKFIFQELQVLQYKALHVL